MALSTRGHMPGPLGTSGGGLPSSSWLRYGPSLRWPGPVGLCLAPPVRLVEPGAILRVMPATLRATALPLFGGQGPRPDEVIQGQVANSPLAAVLVAMAHAGPQMLCDMLTEHRAAVFSRLQSDPMWRWCTDRLYTVQFRSHAPVWLSSLLYHSADGRFMYARTSNGVGWVSFIEKAYAVLRGSHSYNGLNDATPLHQPPSAHQVMDDLVGPHDVLDLSRNRVFFGNGREGALRPTHLPHVVEQAGRLPTIAVSLDTNVPVPSIVARHGYGVLGVVGASNMVQLRYPSGGPDAHVVLSLTDFSRAFKAVLQATSDRP